MPGHPSGVATPPVLGLSGPRGSQLSSAGPRFVPPQSGGRGRGFGFCIPVGNVALSDLLSPGLPGCLPGVGGRCHLSIEHLLGTQALCDLISPTAPAGLADSIPQSAGLSSLDILESRVPGCPIYTRRAPMFPGAGQQGAFAL